MRKVYAMTTSNLAFDGTYLENRLRMRPAGVVSKKLIGERKMANAIRSCSLRLACVSH